MASILRVNTLTDASSNNSTAMSVVNQGTAKAWINLNGTGTIATRDSFNVGSITDNATGEHTVTYSSSMGNNDYSSQTTADSGSGLIATLATEGTMTTTATKTTTYNSSISPTDHAVVCLSTLGDLA